MPLVPEPLEADSRRVATGEAVATDNPLGLTAHHITGSVIDIDRAVDWYQRVLGCRLLEQGSHQAACCDMRN